MLIKNKERVLDGYITRFKYVLVCKRCGFEILNNEAVDESHEIVYATLPCPKCEEAKKKEKIEKEIIEEIIVEKKVVEPTVKVEGGSPTVSLKLKKTEIKNTHRYPEPKKKHGKRT